MPWHEPRLTGASGEPTVREGQGKLTRVTYINRTTPRSYSLLSIPRATEAGTKSVCG